MLTGLSTTQENLIASSYKEVTWLFEITTAGDTIYRWSTKDIAAQTVEGALLDPSSGQISFYSRFENQYLLYAWTYKISKFNGITMRKSGAENRIISPSDITFSVTNENNTLTASDFEDAKVKIVLVLSDGDYTEVIRTWRFQVDKVEDYYQELHFTCEDFVQQYLKGDYPNTRQADGIFPNDNVPKEGTRTRNDNYCVPVPFGTPFIPVRPLYVESEGKVYYLLGPSTPTYALDRIVTPHGYGNKSTWLCSDQHGGEYPFNQSNINAPDASTWKMCEFIIVDTTGDDNPNSNGMWQDGDYLFDVPLRFYRSDTIDDQPCGCNPVCIVRSNIRFWVIFNRS